MPKFFWVGQTPTQNLGLAPFKWNNTNNWRQERTSTGTYDFITVTAATRVPAIASTVDEVFIGYPVVDTTGNKIPARSPLLFGGCTGNVSIAGSLTGGITWEHGSNITGPVYMSIGATFSGDQSLFRMFYPYPMIGGGITGGNGYFSSFQAVKDWVKSTYNLSDAVINQIFSAANLAAEPNKNHLKIKALAVTEQFNISSTNPITISMQIPRTYAKGTTFAATIYDRKSNNTTTILNNSVLLTVQNNASRANSKGPSGEDLPSVNTNNNFTLDACVINRYEGYYDDNVNIKSNCSVTAAEVYSPKYQNTTNDKYEFVKNNFQLSFGGKYGITYTGAILGLGGMVQGNDGNLRLNTTRNNLGQEYNYDYSVYIGQELGVTSYFQSITAYENTVSFKGPVVANTMNSYNSYIVNDTVNRRDKDPVNIVYLNMRDGSKLDLTHNYNFDLWYFGQLPSGQTLVQGGIYATGYDNIILGSPGVKFFNDIMVYSTSLGNRDTGSAKRRTEQETYIGTQPPTAPSVSQ